MRKRTLLIAVSVAAAVVVLAIGVALLLRLGPLSPTAGTAAYPTDAAVMPPLPTPGTQRSTYVDSQYGYSIQYPTAWPLKAPAPGAQVRVFMIADPRTPEAIAFDIQCSANPTQLDAQSWWKQADAADSTAQGVGPLTLASGVLAYVSVGHGQTGYTIYTMVHSTTACQVIAYESDQANAQVITAAVNTFRWQ